MILSVVLTVQLQHEHKILEMMKIHIKMIKSGEKTQNLLLLSRDSSFRQPTVLCYNVKAADPIRNGEIQC